mmetsp:Transcript_11137/g.19606  ORF Transcript_11137/g.19606 Transcript_11137/m.19606 type:complete len:132 (+) Transcript_11137:171-566(+)
MSSLARVALRRASVASRPIASARVGGVRRMGGGHGHVEYTGAEATVRKYLPEDHHIVLANMASWFVFYGLYKVTQIGKKPEPEAPVAAAAAPSSTDGAVPSLFDEGFEEFIKIPGNEEKYAQSLEDWAKTA